VNWNCSRRKGKKGKYRAQKINERNYLLRQKNRRCIMHGSQMKLFKKKEIK
jgi:hypothetical protein